MKEKTYAEEMLAGRAGQGMLKKELFDESFSEEECRTIIESYFFEAGRIDGEQREKDGIDLIQEFDARILLK
jgi:hypothetical protein